MMNLNNPEMKSKIAVLFGPLGGNTERVAKLIYEKIGADKCDLIPVKDASIETILGYNSLIIGGSTIGTHTWSHANTSKDWDEFLPKFRKVDCKGKKVAIFGLGDHIAYTNHFVDDMKIIYDILSENQATIIGQVSTAGYEFNESAAVINDKFVGLPLDEDHEDEKTGERLDHWLADLLKQF